MATLNPILTPQEQSVDTRSRGTIPNRGAETLLKGAATTLEQGVAVGEQIVEDQIVSEVEGERDRLHDEFGVNPTITQLGGLVDQAPDEVKNSIRKLESFQKARDRGTISSLAFNSQVDIVARTLRARHPGFRDQVDEILQEKFYGGDPANRVRNELFANLEVDDTDSQFDRKMLSRRAEAAGLSSIIVGLADGSMSELEASTILAAHNRKLLAIQEARNADPTNEEANRVAVRSYGGALTSMVYTNISSSGLGKEFKAAVNRINTTTSPSSQDIETVAIGIQQLRAARADMEEKLRTDPNFSQALAGLTASQAESVMEDILRPFDSHLELANAGDMTGLQAYNTMMDEALLSERHNLLEVSPALKRWTHLRELLGEQALSIVQGFDGKAFAGIQKDLSKIDHVNDSADALDSGGGAAEALEKTFRTLENTTGIKPTGAQIRAIIEDGYLGVIKNLEPGNPKAEGMISNVYGSDMSRFGATTRDKAILVNDLMAPDVSTSIGKLESERAKAIYSNWAEGAFAQVGRGLLANVRDLMSGGNVVNGSVTYDSNVGRFVWSPPQASREGGFVPSTATPSVATNPSPFGVARREPPEVKALNQLISNYRVYKEKVGGMSSVESRNEVSAFIESATGVADPNRVGNLTTQALEEPKPVDTGNLTGNHAKAYGYFVGKRGLSPVMAAALLGNLEQESGPELDTGAVGDSGAAFGVGQWNGPRKDALFEFAQEQGMDPTNLETQLEFMFHEFETTEKAAFRAASKAETVEEATRILSEKYWRPGDPRMSNRVRFANNVVAALQ